MDRRALAKYLVAQSASELDIAITFIWFRAKFEDAPVTQPRDVFDFFDQEHISKPNRTRLKQRMLADRRLLSSVGGFKLRLSASGHLDEQIQIEAQGPAETATSVFIDALLSHAGQIQNLQTRSFVLEAIGCVQAKCYRAAVIMSWCGAVSILQDFVFETALEAFNADAVANGLLRKEAKSLADIRGISKESAFIEALGRISILDDSMKRGLKRCLDRRNDCSHPGELKLAESAVADHMDTLILNVFEPFSGLAAKAA